MQKYNSINHTQTTYASATELKPVLSDLPYRKKRLYDPKPKHLCVILICKFYQLYLQNNF